MVGKPQSSGHLQEPYSSLWSPLKRFFSLLTSLISLTLGPQPRRVKGKDFSCPTCIPTSICPVTESFRPQETSLQLSPEFPWWKVARSSTVWIWRLYHDQEKSEKSQMNSSSSPSSRGQQCGDPCTMQHQPPVVPGDHFLTSPPVLMFGSGGSHTAATDTFVTRRHGLSLAKATPFFGTILRS